MYTHLFIDLDDTIWDFKANAYAALHICFDKYNVSRYYPNYDDFYNAYEAYNTTLWNLYHHARISRQELMIERFRVPLEQIGVVDTPLVETLNVEYMNELMVQSQLKPYAKELLDYLYTRYPLYIVSNGFKEVQGTKMASAGITHYFKNLFLSDNIGYTKPHPEIFNYILQATGATASNALMIGDNFDADILGAAGCGIDQIYYNPYEKPFEGHTPTHVVKSLDEIITIL